MFLFLQTKPNFMTHLCKTSEEIQEYVMLLSKFYPLLAALVDLSNKNPILNETKQFDQNYQAEFLLFQQLSCLFSPPEWYLPDLLILPCICQRLLFLRFDPQILAVTTALSCDKNTFSSVFHVR